MKGKKHNMAQLNQMEIGSIRELTGAHKMAAVKLSDYANQCNDVQIKEMFEQASRDAKSSIQKLTQFLS